MNESRYWFLTGKYLSKSLTKEEQTELEKYTEASATNREQFDYHIKLWKSFAEGQKDIDFDSRTSWLELKSLIAESEKRKFAETKQLTVWRRLVAACIVALIATSAIIIVNHRSNSIVLATTAEKHLYVLPDSTHVWLNKNSQLRYNSNYGSNKREVHLNGEAYFEVQHNREKPFIIKSNRTYTKVLGTKFNVSSYDTDSSVVVSVVQGKVQFGMTRSEKHALILTQNCTGTYLKNSEGLQKTLAENSNVIAWQTNKLVFVNSPLPYVVEQLQDFYNIQIDVKSPEISSCLFSGTFDNQSLDEVIRILEFTLNLTFLKDTNSVYSVTGQKCSI